MCAISDPYDLVVFEIVKGEFSNCPRALGSIYRGQSYKQLGVGSERKPTWKEGTIAEELRMSILNFTDVHYLIQSPFSEVHMA